MAQRWLRNNVRALGLLLALPCLLAIVGAALVVGGWGASAWSAWQWLGAAALVVAMLLAIPVGYWMSQPRLGYADGHLLVYLKGAEPVRLPIDVVECFFLGETSGLSDRAESDQSKSSAVVVRLAEAAKEWHDRDAIPLLGQWREGYITIRGTWCEPLNGELLQKLNERLIAAHREQRACQQDRPS